jgi:hypothetical protein
MALKLFAETIKHELTHPVSKESTGLTLELVGTEHDDVYEASIKVMKDLSAKGIKESIDFQLSIDLKIALAAACIAGWEIVGEEHIAEWTEVFKKLGFEDASFSVEKALKLCSMKTAGWIRTQIDTAIGERQRFFTSALTTSLTQ